MTLRPSAPRARRRWFGLVTAVVAGLVLAGGAALAVHDEQFQLDGNTVVDASPPDEIGDPPVPNPFANTDYDWESLFTDPSVPQTGPGNSPTENASLPANLKDVEFIEDWSLVEGVYQTSDPTTFTQSKDIAQISSGWRCKAANQVTNKGDITNAYAAVYDDGENRILYFGLEKDQDSGSNNVGLWLLQGQISCAGGGSGNGNAFQGNHVEGDIFLVSEFTNGGGVSTIRAYQWLDDINPSKNGDQPGVDPTPFAISADCVVSQGFDDRLCATSNRTNIEPAWTSWSFENGVNNEMRPATFVEGGIDLNGFPQFQNKCFSRFLFNTRSSQELTATLYDYALGNINTCNANVSIAASATNAVGNAHTFTITANALGGITPTSIAITPSVSPTPSSQSSTCATPTLSNGGTTATCTVTVNSTSAGTFTANASATFNFADSASIVRSTSGDSGPGGSGPATKTFVDARISIGTAGTNKVGDPHTFTVTVQKNSGSGFVAAGDVTVTPSLGSGSAGSITGGTCVASGVTKTNASGQCTIIVSSSATGTATVHAAAAVTVAGTVGSAVVNVSTTGNPYNGAGASVSNTKTWVDARISLATAGTNKVGDAHTFTVTVEKDAGTGSFVAAADVTVTPSISGTGSITGGTCVASGVTKTNASGQCTIIVNSSSAGTGTVNAAATVNVAGAAGSANVAVSTTGTPYNGAGATVSNTKTWVDARINIATSATNNITESHTFTVTVQKNSGSGFVAAPGVSVTAVLASGSVGGISLPGSTCDDSATNASGQCLVVVTSNVAGTATVNVSATVNVAGTSGSANVPVSTAAGGYNSTGATVSNVKTWVDGSLTWLKHDGDGELLAGAEFKVCRTHTFDSDTAMQVDTTDVCYDPVVDDTDGTDGPVGVGLDQDGTGGEFKLTGLVLGRYTIQETKAPAGYHADLDLVQTVNLTIASPNGAAANPFVNLKAFRIIVLTCDDITDTLVTGSVSIDFDGPGGDPAVVLDTIEDVPAALIAKSVTEANLCGLGGASFGDLDEGTYSVSVTVPKANPV